MGGNGSSSGIKGSNGGKNNETQKDIIGTQQIAGITVDVQPTYHAFSDGTHGGTGAIEEAIMYEFPNGITFYMQKNADASKISITAEQFAKVYASSPDYIINGTAKIIESVGYKNPADEYWRKVYKNFTSSAATGGDKTITFYGVGWRDTYSLKRTFWHESGHSIDYKASTQISTSSLWGTAMANDLKFSKLKSITSYGENSVKEDFAESIDYFTNNRTKFKLKMPNRAAIIEHALKEKTWNIDEWTSLPPLVDVIQ